VDSSKLRQCLAIPAIMLTRGARRKPLLCAGLLGFLVANTVTALAPDLALALAVRFIAGAFAGLLWGRLAGCAMRITAPERAEWPGVEPPGTPPNQGAANV
jgi:predicted MFS family arabinose efflux permease